MPNDDLDVILLDYRGVKLTFRLPVLEQDSNGEIIEDIRFGEDGALSSVRFDRLITYANIAADFLDAERAKGGLLQAAHQMIGGGGGVGGPVAYATPPGVPPMGGGVPTGYAPPPVADRTCPKCGGGLLPEKQTSRGPVRECAQQRGVCVNGKGYPNSVWMTQQGRG